MPAVSGESYPSLSTLNMHLSITADLTNQVWFWLGVADI
jgi:hypothetical protein